MNKENEEVNKPELKVLTTDRSIPVQECLDMAAKERYDEVIVIGLREKGDVENMDGEMLFSKGMTVKDVLWMVKILEMRLLLSEYHAGT